MEARKAQNNLRGAFPRGAGGASEGPPGVGSAPRKAVLALALFVGLGAAVDGQGWPGAAGAGTAEAAAGHGPAAQVRGTIDRVIQILMRPDLESGARAEERRELLRREIAPAFDFEEMSKRSLGQDWRKRTAEERSAFVRVFTELLENAYVGKIESYRGETINYVKETIDSPYAVVATVIVTSRGQEVRVDYRLLREGERWRVYDVVIEGVSLVNNYRSQFNTILRKSSFPEMMDKLRDTIRRQKS